MERRGETGEDDDVSLGQRGQVVAALDGLDGDPQILGCGTSEVRLALFQLGSSDRVGAEDVGSHEE